MKPPPGALRVEWTPRGVEVAFHPLRPPAGEAEPFWMGAVGMSGLLAFAATPPLVLLSALELVNSVVPPMVLAAMALLGVLAEGGLRWRRKNAHLTLRLHPDRLDLCHRIGGFTLVTERIELDRIRRVELDGDTLRLSCRDGRTVHEPLPGLSDGARAWLVELLGEARRSNADFWRGQVELSAAHDGIKQLAEQVSRTR